jgi:PAS domain S-box-containing protein
VRDHDSEPALLEAIVRSATDYAIITLGPDNRITSWNPGAEVLLGWKVDEIIGRGGELIFTPEDRANDVPAEEMRTAEAKGRAEDERWHTRKDGTRFWGSGVMVPLKGEPGFLKIMRDRTPERQAQMALSRSERRFRTLAANIPQLVWRSAALGQRTWPSPQWVAFTGLSEEASAGLGWLSSIHPDDRERTIDAWYEAERIGQFSIENRVRRAADAEYRWFYSRATRSVTRRPARRNGSARTPMCMNCVGPWNASRFSSASFTIEPRTCWPLWEPLPGRPYVAAIRWPSSKKNTGKGCRRWTGSRPSIAFR